MTWAKYGVEFFDELADLDLSDAAVRTHAEAVHYAYRTENADLRIPVRSLRRFAGSSEREVAAKELVAAGLWRCEGDAYVIVHHADVIRQSIAAQQKHRETEKARLRRKRAKDGADVSADVGTNVGANVRATQTDRQTPVVLLRSTHGKVLRVRRGARRSKALRRKLQNRQFTTARIAGLMTFPTTLLTTLGAQPQEVTRTRGPATRPRSRRS
jgi:hypothetical protein